MMNRKSCRKAKALTRNASESPNDFRFFPIVSVTAETQLQRLHIACNLSGQYQKRVDLGGF
jgi:hypothetical protein